MSRYVAEVTEAYGADTTALPLEAVDTDAAKAEAHGLTSRLPRVSNGGKVAVWCEDGGTRTRVGEWGWLGIGGLGFIWSDWGI